MNASNLHMEAEANMFRLGCNVYPGRGIAMGVSADGRYVVQVYWIMGRSENSRNRIFSNQGGRVFTEAADPKKVKDPSLIIYNAMDEFQGNFIVSNGSQTDAVVKSLRDEASQGEKSSGLFRALQKFAYEPDEPNFTPRITALYAPKQPRFQFSILRKSRWDDSCVRSFETYDVLRNGTGMCVTTYQEDGDPLPSFEGSPYPVAIEKKIETVAETFWDSLNPQNRVSLVVKFIEGSDSEVQIVNQYEKVSA